MTSSIVNEREERIFWRNISELPYFRGLLRAVEAKTYLQIDLPRPVLDLGCGDGHFASVAFDHPLEIGLDPWVGPLRKAKQSGAYQDVLHGNGNAIPFPDGSFESAISNSVLEHIPDLDPVLGELNRILKKGAPFVFCVPNHLFLRNLSISQFLRRLGLNPLAASYEWFFNKISRHYHCDSPETWTERLMRNGFHIDQYWHYFSPKAFHILEWGHYFGLPSLVSQKLTGKWILLPTKWNLWITEKVTKKYFYENQNQNEGSYTFYIAHKH